MTYTPKTQEQARTAIESLEAKASDMASALLTGLADVADNVRVAVADMINDCLAQRDAIAERMVDLPTEAELRVQREMHELNHHYEQVRNEPYGADDFQAYNMSNDCW